MLQAVEFAALTLFVIGLQRLSLAATGACPLCRLTPLLIFMSMAGIGISLCLAAFYATMTYVRHPMVPQLIALESGAPLDGYRRLRPLLRRMPARVMVPWSALMANLNGVLILTVIGILRLGRPWLSFDLLDAPALVAFVLCCTVCACLIAPFAWRALCRAVRVPTRDLGVLLESRTMPVVLWTVMAAVLALNTAVTLDMLRGGTDAVRLLIQAEHALLRSGWDLVTAPLYVLDAPLSRLAELGAMLAVAAWVFRGTTRAMLAASRAERVLTAAALGSLVPATAAFGVMMRLLVAAFPHHPATEHRICDAASLAKLLMAGYAADSPFRYVQAEVNGQHVSVVLLTGTSYADDRPTWLRDDILAAVGGVTRYEQLVDDRLVSAAPSRPVYLVGHSLGGMIAELIASRPPHGVRIAGVQTYGAPKVARHRVPAARYAIPLDPAVRSAMLWQPWESSDPQYTYVDAGVLTGRVPGAVTGPLYFLTGITSTAFLPLDAPLGAFLHVDYDGAVGLERYPALPGLARHACIDLQVVPDQPGGQAMARPART